VNEFEVLNLKLTPNYFY